MKSLADIRSTFRFPTDLLAVHHHYGPEGIELHLVRLCLKGEEIERVESRSAPDLATLMEGLPELPSILLVTGKKVLSKKLPPAAEGTPEEELLDRAFPNVEQDGLAFEVNILPGTGEQVVSACRKANLEELLEGWPLKYRPIDLGLGLYSLWPLLARMDSEVLELGGHRIEVSTGEVALAEDLKPGSISVWGEEMESQVALAFLYGLQQLGGRSFTSSFGPVVENRQEWKYGRLYRTALAAGTGSLFVLLLVSFLLFGHYSEKASGLSLTTSAHQQQITEVASLKEAYGQKQQFLEVNGPQSRPASGMADEIALLLPREVSLREMAFNPVEKRLKKENLVRFNRNGIVLKGETEGYAPFQQWLAALKKLEWAEEIAILGYEEEGSRHEARFIINIQARP